MTRTEALSRLSPVTVEQEASSLLARLALWGCPRSCFRLAGAGLLHGVYTVAFGRANPGPAAR